MEMTGKLHPGKLFSPEIFKRLDGPDYALGTPGRWQALFVFRGKHCPICMSYLGKIEARREAFSKLGIEVAAISADSEEQTRITASASNFGFPLLYGMDITTMQRLGLYISDPRSEQETDHPFPEPALVVINPQGVIQIVEIANAPFVRLDLDTLIGGLGFVIERDYPIRGTHL